MSVRASSAPATVIQENGANQNTDGASKENKSAPHQVGTTTARYARHKAIGTSRASNGGRLRLAAASTTMTPVQTAPIQKPYPSLNSLAVADLKPERRHQKGDSGGELGARRTCRTRTSSPSSSAIARAAAPAPLSIGHPFTETQRPESGPDSAG